MPYYRLKYVQCTNKKCIQNCAQKRFTNADIFKKKNATKSESISNQIQSCKHEKLSENKIYELFVPTSI